MQKILRKRVLRDLKENLLRYLALGFLIILGMYIIVSLVGAADTIIIGGEQHAEANCIEDGEFQLFVPLTAEEVEQIEGQGVTLEPMFYLDFLQEDETTLRIFKNREAINLLELDEGELPQTVAEIVLEKRYCEENDIAVGDEIVIANRNYSVVGIGSVPDYDAPLKNMSDASVDSKSFGIAFMVSEAYEKLKASGLSVKSEEYVYAYRLNGAMSDEELKEQLQDLELSIEDVEDVYFKEYWDETVGEKEDFEEGIEDLVEGSRELSDGALELSDGAKELSDGAKELSDGALELSDGAGVLSDGAASLSDGAKTLSDGTGQLVNGAVTLSNGALELSNGTMALIDGSKTLSDGIQGVTAFVADNPMLSAGAASLYSGSVELMNGTVQLYGGTNAIYSGSLELASGSVELYDGSIELSNGASELSDGAAELYNGSKELYDGSTELYDGSVDLYDGTVELSDGAAELYDGMLELQDATDELMEEYFNIEISNLVSFMPVEDNPRVGASADDQIVNKEVGLLAGVIIMVLFTYVISVFVVHSIDKESSIIGALYALGVRRKELIRHYLMLPMIVTFLGGVIGTAFGYSRWGIDTQMGDCYGYFSMPILEIIYEPYLLVYGIIMPPVVAALVNYFVIRKRLNQPALRLIRGEQKKRKERNIDLGNMGFISRFRVRQMMRELRTSFTVWFGMFISLLIMMLGINCYVLCEHIRIENQQDTRYEYMYTYKYPEEEVPEGGEACYAVTLKKEVLGYNLDVTILGIDEDNPYFLATPEEGKSKVIISSAMAQKYALSVGDKLILTDEEEEMDYAFTVQEIVQYSPGFYVFMDIDSMRELFGQGEDYYNVVFSNQELAIDSGRLYAVTAKADIEKSSSIFSSMMMPMVTMMTVVATLIFVVVMYLMMKVMIDRSSFGISLMKIFGYRPKEIKKLYLNGNFYTVAVGAAICLPVSKWLMDAMYPMMVANIACGINLTFEWQMYVGIYGAILVLYFIINWLLVGHLKKMIPAEVLKNRE